MAVSAVSTGGEAPNLQIKPLSLPPPVPSLFVRDVGGGAVVPEPQDTLFLVRTRQGQQA